MKTARKHLTLGFIVSVIYFILFLNPTDFWNYPKVLFLWLFLSAAADYDKGVGLQHRDLIFHSIVLPVTFWICFFEFNIAIAIWIWSFHILSDIYQSPGKQPKLGYLLHFLGHTFSARGTRALLFLNGFIGILLSIILGMIS